MTREEAIDCLEGLKIYLKTEHIDQEAVDIAIKALEKEPITRCKECEQLYVYAVPDAMIDHKFSDDVAITWATNKAEAIEKFSKYYNNVQDEDVNVVRFNRGGVSILTDY